MLQGYGAPLTWIGSIIHGLTSFSLLQVEKSFLKKGYRDGSQANGSYIDTPSYMALPLYPCYPYMEHLSSALNRPSCVAIIIATLTTRGVIKNRE